MTTASSSKDVNEVAGYLHPTYAESLTEFGTPVLLPASQGWILQRQIPGLPYHDAMGCYPIFACEDWSSLCDDLEALRSEIITLALVADPFGNFTPALLQKCFGDIVIPFKTHYVTDLTRESTSYISKHHRYYARRVLGRVSVEINTKPSHFVEEWTAFYRVLIERHKLSGIKSFSRVAFASQLSVPGIVMFRVLFEGNAVGAHLWYVQGGVAYSHLSAFNHKGYELMASFALYWSAIEFFRDKVKWLDLGSGAGTEQTEKDGLTRFKQGWSTGTKTAFFCGRIFDKSKYETIVQARCKKSTSYFPAYRQGEF